MSPRLARRARPGSPAALAVLAALSGAACEQPRPALPPAPVEPAAAGTATTAPLADVRVLLDGVRVPDVPAARIASWSPLELTLPPGHAPGRWRTIELVSDDARPPVRIEDPLATYRGQVLALLPGAAGVSLGVFTPATLAARGKPTVEFPSVREIRVILAPVADGRGGSSGGGDGDGNGRERVEPVAVTITLTDRSGTRTLDRTALDAAPARTAPLGDTETKGWSLTDLLGAAKAKAGKRWRLVDESGATLELAAADLAPDRGFGFLKLNRQGQIRFKWFVRDGDAWKAAGDLRGLTSITALR
jgi:hypothetical protein